MSTSDLDHLRALPCWQGKITAEPLSGGLSNESWKVTDSAGLHVARFGRDYPFHHVDRTREALTAKAACDAGFAPKVEYTAPGVMVSAFIPSRTLDAAEVCAAPERIGALLADFHDTMPRQITGAPYLFWVFHVIRDYARTLADSRYDQHLPEWLALSDRLAAMQVAMPIVFGHHDLLPANFLDDGTRLWLIDFEYAGFGTAMFDLAGVAANAAMDEKQSQRLLRTYLKTDPNADFLRAFAAMQAAALLREAMWGMVSERHLSTPDVDFRAYAEENLTALERSVRDLDQTYGKALK